PLCQDADQRRSEEIVLDAHIDKPCYCTWRIIRMERAKDQMARKSGPDRNVGSLEIANLSDHDDVGILTDDVTQSRSECKTDLRIHVDLIDAIHLILDRIFDRDDLANR